MNKIKLNLPFQSKTRKFRELISINRMHIGLGSKLIDADINVAKR